MAEADQHGNPATGENKCPAYEVQAILFPIQVALETQYIQLIFNRRSQTL